MELLVPTWSAEGKDPEFRVADISDEDPTEFPLEKPWASMPLALPVPIWMPDNDHKVGSVSIQPLEEDERSDRTQLIPRTSPMLLPLFPWNVTMEFCAASGLLVSKKSFDTHMEFDLQSPPLHPLADMTPSPSSSTDLVLRAPQLTAQDPYSSIFQSSEKAGFSFPSVSSFVLASQLPAPGDISTTQTMKAYHPPTCQQFNPEPITSSSFVPEPRYGTQASAYSFSTLGTTPQPSFRTEPPPAAQKSRSVSTDESTIDACIAKRFRSAMDRNTGIESQRSPFGASRLPPIPPLIPIPPKATPSFPVISSAPSQGNNMAQVTRVPTRKSLLVLDADRSSSRIPSTEPTPTPPTVLSTSSQAHSPVSTLQLSSGDSAPRLPSKPELQMTVLRKGPSSLAQATSALVKESQDNSKKRHIPLIPTPTFVFSRPMNGASTTKCKSVSQSRQRVCGVTRDLVPPGTKNYSPIVSTKATPESRIPREAQPPARATVAPNSAPSAPSELAPRRRFQMT